MTDAVLSLAKGRAELVSHDVDDVLKLESTGSKVYEHHFLFQRPIVPGYLVGRHARGFDYGKDDVMEVW